MPPASSRTLRDGRGWIHTPGQPGRLPARDLRPGTAPSPGRDELGVCGGSGRGLGEGFTWARHPRPSPGLGRARSGAAAAAAERCPLSGGEPPCSARESRGWLGTVPESPGRAALKPQDPGTGQGMAGNSPRELRAGREWSPGAPGGCSCLGRVPRAPAPHRSRFHTAASPGPRRGSQGRQQLKSFANKGGFRTAAVTTAPGKSSGTENAALQICLREGQSRAGPCCPGRAGGSAPRVQEWGVGPSGEPSTGTKNSDLTHHTFSVSGSR